MSIHQHPLAYLLGLEGLALMRAFAGDHDRDFTQARIAEVRALLDRADDFGDGVDLEPMPSAEGYDVWAPAYDSPDNPFFAMDESVLLPILDTLPPGDAIDAMCGTGRYAGHLAARGHRVRGFDSSPGMLDLARTKLPDVEFDLADVAAMPVPDACADVVVNALAINHVDDLGPAFAEAVRVLRPGGHLLLCSMVGYFPGSRLSPLLEHNSKGEIGYIREWNHSTGEILRAALGAGFTVRDCQELVAERSSDEYDGELELPAPGEPMSIWQLHPWVPTAASAVRNDRVCLVGWHFELPRPPATQ
ncbi:class I SAM-dependent methyltransferase [Nocardioides sp.]|uniref:class I SAM-dependent methyltransferase n=1 Tax=Nocardioides sp. TaxID=35761 RepID=UPI002CAB2F3E|nr:class I SAM-dependent methyltransferase [Nocardioides sp.]HXH81264.1 class I SAM-dependent methyltransferase [Nocardioides sp.]